LCPLSEKEYDSETTVRLAGLSTRVKLSKDLGPGRQAGRRARLAGDRPAAPRDPSPCLRQDSG